MTDKKSEQLFRDVNPKLQDELKKEPAVVSEEKVKEKVEEIKEEPKVGPTPEPKPEPKKKVKKKLFKSKEKLSEDEAKEEPEEAEEEKKPEEAPVEEKTPEKETETEEPEVKEEPAKEKIEEEIKATKEELAVIKEVRNELVKIYAQYSDLNVSKEQLSKKFEKLSKENDILKEQLLAYKDAEEKLNAHQKLERLEKLSAKFKLLGHEKSVEQLAEKDEGTLEELDNIVDTALEKVGETKESPEITTPSQATEPATEEAKTEVKSDEIKKETKVAEHKPESNEQFFKGILNQMTKEQLHQKRESLLM